VSPFSDHLPALLRQLADPVTPHTAVELWCRIAADGWDRHVPALLHELQKGENDVKRLVLEIAREHAVASAAGSLDPFFSEAVRLLADEDRLLRMAAINAVHHLAERHQYPNITLQNALVALRIIVCRDELPLARQALLTLIELDDNSVIEFASLLRARQA